MKYKFKPKSKMHMFFLYFLVVALILGMITTFFYPLFLAVSLEDFAHEGYKQRMIKNIDNHKGEFYDIERFVNSIDPDHKIQKIEFGVTGDDEFYVSLNEEVYYGSSKTIESWKPRNVKSIEPWTKEKLSNLQKKLTDINCQSIIYGSDPVSFVSDRNYFYDLYYAPVKEHLYADTCHFFIFSPNIIIRYSQLSDWAEACFH